MRYSGGWTALKTPFNDDFTVNWAQLEANVGFQLEEGISGLLPMGTTGESATVTHEEHSQIIYKVNEYVGGRCNVLAGTGSNSTSEALYETKLAVDAGIKACLLVDCYYNKPSSLELRKEYYSPILSEFPDTDFIAYAIPGRSVTVISPEDLAIIRAENPNLVAVKEATGDFNRMKRTRQLLDGEFNIISGDDPNTYKMMSDGSIDSSGVISVISNITPAPIEKYTRLLLEGKIKEAKKIDAALTPLFNVVGVKTEDEITLPNGSRVKVVNKCPNPVPVKTMMRGLGMIDGWCKRPLGRLTKNGVTIVRKALQDVWENYPQALEPIESHYDVSVAERLDDDGIWKALSY